MFKITFEGEDERQVRDQIGKMFPLSHVFGNEGRAIDICRILSAYTNALPPEVRQMLSRIVVIKIVRDLTGLSLQVAKEITESHGFPPNWGR